MPNNSARLEAASDEGHSLQDRLIPTIVRFLRRAALPLVALLTLGVAWEVGVRLSGVADYLVPTPSAVGSRLFDDLGYFLFHGLITLVEALGGFAMGQHSGCNGGRSHGPLASV